MNKSEGAFSLRASSLEGRQKQHTRKEHHGDFQATVKRKQSGTLTGERFISKCVF